MTPPQTPLPTPEPIFDTDTEPYWRAAGQGQLLLTRCDHCRTYVWIPRPYCPIDLAPTSWVQATGRGTVYSHTTVHRGERAYAKRPPFVLAYVELDEGPRIMTNIIGCHPHDVAIGMPVRATFDPVEEHQGIAIPRFTPL